MDTGKLWITAKAPISREELERVVRKEKIDALTSWLTNHFTCDRKHYREKSPILILKGPSGCGKTTALKYISHELGIPIKEYHDTTDDTALYHPSHTSVTFTRRQANKFEQFVMNHLKFSCLPMLNDEDNDHQASINNKHTVPCSQTLPQITRLSPAIGVIILVETPMSICKSKDILIESMFRLRHRLKQLSLCIKRRVAIIFETLDNDAHLLMPVKTKQHLQIDDITFNPVTKTNLVKLIKLFLGERTLDKGQMETIISHCDGDVRACINSLQAMFEHKINLNDIHFAHPSKAKRMKHELSLNTSMLKGENLQVNFFHVLGKIFYQKRIYPDKSTDNRYKQPMKYRSVERPYPTKNNSSSLLEMLDVSPETLISWLYHNYSKFCNVQDVLKASLFLENISAADMTSLNMLQSTQFYESHYHCDQVQSIISIEATTYSLYTDNSDKDVSNNKKKKVKGEPIIKSSVDTTANQNSDSTNDGKYYFKNMNFEKPPYYQLNKLLQDYESLVETCSAEFAMIDRKKVCLDYMPYGPSLNHSRSGYGTICEKYNEFKFGRSISDYEALDLDLKQLMNTHGHQVTKDSLNNENCDDESIITDQLDVNYIDEAHVPHECL